MKFTSPTVRIAASVFLVFALALTALGQTTTPPKWKQGDVFLGVGGGQWKIFRPSTATIMDSVSDGLGGATNGSAIDNTWHLVGTDSGTSGNLSKIVRFSISPHDPNNPSAVADVLSVVNADTHSSVNAQAVVIDGSGNYILANSSPPTILKFSPSGSFLQAFSLTGNVDNTLTSIDLSADGNTLYYTSGGNATTATASIRALNLTNGGVTTIAALGQVEEQAVQLYGLRFVPPGGFPSGCSSCPSAGGFLVAAQVTDVDTLPEPDTGPVPNFTLGASVMVIDLSGHVLHQYTVPGQTDLRVLALDPLVQDTSANKIAPDHFWVAGPSSGSSFFRVSLSTGFVDTFSAGSVSAITSLATYGGFSANEPIPTQFPAAALTGTTTSATNSAIFLFGTDQLTATGYGFGTGVSTNLSVFASAIQPSAGVSDTGRPCTQTFPGGRCAVWEIDTDNPLPTGADMSIKIFATGLPTDANTRILRNEREDVTTLVANIDPAAHSRFSVYTLIEVPGNTGLGCSYLPPITLSSIFENFPLVFAFKCPGLPGKKLATLKPRISVAQLASGAAPQQFFPCTTPTFPVPDPRDNPCGKSANYTFIPILNVWAIVVNFEIVNTKTNFIATTFDDNNIASSFFIQFTVVH